MSVAYDRVLKNQTGTTLTQCMRILFVFLQIYTSRTCRSIIPLSHLNGVSYIVMTKPAGIVLVGCFSGLSRALSTDFVKFWCKRLRHYMHRYTQSQDLNIMSSAKSQAADICSVLHCWGNMCWKHPAQFMQLAWGEVISGMIDHVLTTGKAAWKSLEPPEQPCMLGEE